MTYYELNKNKKQWVLNNNKISNQFIYQTNQKITIISTYSSLQLLTLRLKLFTMHKEILQYLSAPKRPPRLTSFKKYYFRSLRTSPDHSEQQSKFSTLDESLINKIDSIVPRKIHRHLDKQTTKSVKVKTEQSINHIENQDQFQMVYSRIRKKSLRKAQLQALVEQKIQNKYKQKKQRESKFFKYEEIKWVQRKLQKTDKRGKYSQKLHPMCYLYQQFAEKIVSNRFCPPNPFEGYQHIDF